MNHLPAWILGATIILAAACYATRSQLDSIDDAQRRVAAVQSDPSSTPQDLEQAVAALELEVSKLQKAMADDVHDFLDPRALVANALAAGLAFLGTNKYRDGRNRRRGWPDTPSNGVPNGPPQTPPLPPSSPA